MKFHADSYRAGYDAGQHDLLTLLACRGDCGEDDYAARAVADDGCRVRYRLWCLAHNLAIGSALDRAFGLGYVVIAKLIRQHMAGDWSAEPLWKPGCGRSAPR